MDPRATIDIAPGTLKVRRWLSPKSGRWKAPLLVFLAGLFFWTAMATYLRRPFVGDFTDDGLYLVAARSLCDGNGYRLPSRLGNPVATKYPIGTSALAAVAMTLLPGPKSTHHDWVAGRIVVILAALGLAEISRRFFLRNGFSSWSASLFALVLIWHPDVFNIASTLMSDLIFALLTLVILVRWFDRPGAVRDSALPWFIDGLLVGLAVLVRSNGVTLVCASLFAGLLSGRRRVLNLAAVLIGIGLLWLPSTMLVGLQSAPRDTGGYATEQKAAYRASDHSWSIPVRNVSLIPSVLTAVILSPLESNWRISFFLERWKIVKWGLEAVTVATIILGAVVLWRRRVWPLAIWINAGLTLIVFMLWHSPFGFRFGLPLNPLILSTFAVGLNAIERPSLSRPLVALVALSASLVTVAETALHAYPHDGVVGTEYRFEDPAIFELIRAQLPLDAVVVCGMPELIYLNSGRVAVPLREDDQIYAGKRPEWKRIQAWLALDASRPVYLLDDPGGSEKERVRWIPQLARENQLNLKGIPGTKDRLWRLDSTARLVHSTSLPQADKEVPAISHSDR